MHRTLFPSALGAVIGLMAAVPAQGIGFARTANNTLLGQPLDFAAFVRLEDGETLPRDCVVADVSSGETRLLGAQVRVTVQPSALPTERVVRVTTTVPIDEPVVTVDVVIGCTGRLTRSFVAFVDPPAVALPEAAQAEALPPQRFEPQVAPVVDAVRDIAAAAAGASAPAPGPAQAGAEAAARPPPPRTRVAAQARPARARDTERPSVPAPAAPPRPAPTGPRLKLDPAAQVIAMRSAPAAADPSAVPAAAVVAAAAPATPPATVPDPPTPVATAASSVEQLAAQIAVNEQLQRMVALEQTLQRMRAEAEATQARLAGLQAELKSVRAAGQDGHPLLVPLLAAACALLALALAVVWWRRTRERSQPIWWSPPAPAAPAAPLPAPAAPAEPDPTHRDTLAGVRPAVATPPDSPRLDPLSGFGPPRELSVEELIDLEQQADFFVVLGQDDAAIDLLVGHVRSTGGSSPLPYLKLLEIYARRADHEAYERTRDRFNRRFNAYAPQWGAGLQDGKGLEAYPAVIGRLQQLWRSPHRVMEVMDTLLFRRDAAAPTFDLPAYREVLFLYSIARDLVQTGNAQPLPPRRPSGVNPPLPVEPERNFAEDTLPLLTNVPEGYRPTEAPPARALDIDLTEPAPLATDFRGLIDPARKPDGG